MVFKSVFYFVGSNIVQMSMMGDTNSKKYKIGYLPYENVIFSAENVMVS